MHRGTLRCFIASLRCLLCLLLLRKGPKVQRSKEFKQIKFRKGIRGEVPIAPQAHPTLLSFGCPFQALGLRGGGVGDGRGGDLTEGTRLKGLDSGDDSGDLTQGTRLDSGVSTEGTRLRGLDSGNSTLSWP